MYNTGNKLVLFQLQNAKANFPKFCKVYAQQNQKTNLIIHSKIVFKKISRLKLSLLKKYTTSTYLFNT